MFRIIVDEIKPSTDLDEEALPPTTRYTQTVDALDLIALIAAVNKGPRKARTRKVGAGQ